MKHGQQGYSKTDKGGQRKKGGKRGKVGPWPRLQKFWDIRAACNFIGGGTGAGLLLVAGFYALQGLDNTPLVIAGFLSISFGLFMVFLEIGRPWRSINLFFHPQTSWMTREGIVAIPLYVSMALSVFFAGQFIGVLASISAALLAGLFLYCQMRILHAARGIPAWRHVAIKPYMLITGMTEGLALALCISVTSAHTALVPILALLLFMRLGFWLRYAHQLRIDGAPEASCNKVDDLFIWTMVGNLLPVVLLMADWWLDVEAIVVLAGLIAAFSGWYTKAIVVTKAAQTRGFRLPRTPVRGQGQSRVVGQSGFRQNQ